jgi:uncharacterized RDD family membrane protein YckC
MCSCSAHRLSSIVAACIVPAGYLLTASPALGEDRAATLTLAASDEHIWFLAAPSNAEELRLLHHAMAMDGPFYTPGPVLAAEPEAMAAWADTVWIVTAQDAKSSSSPSRTVFSVRVQQNPALGGYYFVPHGHLTLEPALPGHGDLVAFAAGAEGPVALMLQSPAENSGRPSSIQNIGARLLQLVNGRWDQIALPEGVSPSADCFLALGGVDARTLTMVAPDDEPASATLLTREPGGAWVAQTIELDLDDVVGLTRYQSQVVAVIVSRGARDAQLKLIRPDGVFDLDRFERPVEPWAIGGQQRWLVAIDTDARGEPGWRRFDPITRTSTGRQIMEHQPLGTTRLIHIPLLIATAVTALMLVLLFRPASPPGAVELPATAVVASPLTRLLALAIDLVPGAVIAMLATKSSLLDLARLPVWTARIEDGVPALIMIMATMAHCTFSELCWRRTLGKAVMALQVVSLKGERASTMSILLRNAAKLVVLLVPPLAAVALLNRHMQGLDDMVGRTVVVTSVAGSGQRPDRPAR